MILRKIFSFFRLLVFWVIIMTIPALFADFDGSRGTFGSLCAILFGVILFFYWPFIILKNGWKKRCPNCKKLFARQIVDQDYVGSDTEYETVTKQDKITNTRGETRGYINREEQVAVNYDTYRNYCKCKKCGYEWTYRISVRS